MPLVSHELWTTHVKISRIYRLNATLLPRSANNHKPCAIGLHHRYPDHHYRAIHSTQSLYHGVVNPVDREVLETFKRTRTSVVS